MSSSDNKTYQSGSERQRSGQPVKGNHDIRSAQPIKGNHDIELQRINSYMSDSSMKDIASNGDMETLRSTGGNRRSPSPALIRAQSQTNSPRSSPGQLQQHRSNSPLPLHHGRIQSPSHSHSQSHCYNRTPSPQCHNSVNMKLNSVNRMTSPTMLAMSSPVPIGSCKGEKHLGHNMCTKSPQLVFHAKSVYQNSPSLNVNSIRSPVSAFNQPQNGQSFRSHPQSPVQMTSQLRNINPNKLTATISHRPSSRSPIMQSHFSHSSRARSNSPKLVGTMGGQSRRMVQNHTTSSFSKPMSKSLRHAQPKQYQAESTTEYHSGTVSPVHQDGTIGQRQDPTTRDLQFLGVAAPGGNSNSTNRNINSSKTSDPINYQDDNGGFGSDSELIMVEKAKPGTATFCLDENEQDRRRPASSSASVPLARNEQRQRRPSSCGVVSSKNYNTVSPTAGQGQSYRNKQSKSQEPGAQTRQQQESEPECNCGVPHEENIEEDEESEKCANRRGMSTQPQQRTRASSWDCPASLTRRRKARQLRPSNQGMQFHMHAKQKHQMQWKSGVGMGQNKFQQQNSWKQTPAKQIHNQNNLNLHQQQFNQSNRNRMAENEALSQNPLDAIAGMSLEDVFQLERVLHSYKEQLLRQRVYSTPEGINQQSSLNPNDQTGYPSENGCSYYPDHEQYDGEASEGVDSMILGSTCHPPERCQSGNCFFDDGDEACIGTMEFEEYEPTYQFQMDQTNSGVRAPNFKMFCSADPQRQQDRTPSTQDDSTDTTQTSSISSKQSTKEPRRNLSQSPGNISFVNRLAMHLEYLKQKPIHSKDMRKFGYVSLKENNAHDNINITSEPGGGLELMSSPRSAFSRAPVVSNAT